MLQLIEMRISGIRIKEYTIDGFALIEEGGVHRNRHKSCWFTSLLEEVPCPLDYICTIIGLTQRRINDG